MTKKVLHVGCGPKREDALMPALRGPDWQEVRLDLNPDVQPDMVADIRDMQPVQDASMDAVWSSHNIEHLYPHDVPRALSEFYRVLKEGGILVLALPDMQRVAAFVAAGMLEEPLYNSPAGPISAIDMMYGFRPSMAAGNLFMAHKTAFTALSLAKALLEAGFSDVSVVRRGFDLEAVGVRRAEKSQPRDRFQLTDEGGPAPKNLTKAA